MQSEPICEADLEEVSQFLRKTFGADENWRPFQPDVLRWKALTPHPLWQGSRGYALRNEGEIVAYGCVMPTRLMQQNAGEVLVACVVDWAASKAMPGSGVSIYRCIAELTDALIGLGGSNDAQRVVKRMGFETRQEFEVSARVTRPVQRFMQARPKAWRDFARLGRNLWRGLHPVSGGAEGWTARRVQRFEQSLDPVLPLPGLVSATVCYRDSNILNYFLLCPAARMEGYVVEHEERAVGYFLLAHTSGECRIAEIWIASGKEEDWLAALLLTFKEQEGNQVSVGCGTNFARRIAALAGLYPISRQPIYVKDTKGLLPRQMDAAINLVDTDAFLL